AGAMGGGRRLVGELRGHGCDRSVGDEDLAESSGVSAISLSLRRIAAKLDPGWMVRWITNPHAFRPRTRMPNFMFDEDQAVAIAAFLLSDTKQPSEEWRAAHAAPAVDGGQASRGKELVGSLGCRACHALAPDEVAGQLGANKDIAPNLSAIAEKTDAVCHDRPGMERESRIGVELSSFASKTREELFFGDRTDIPETWDDWTYNKLLLPRTYATKWIEQVMPQFDLADEDIKALRAFLASRTDAKVPVRYTYHAPGEERIIAGRRLVARYNCTGCHVIENTGGDIRRLYVA